MTVDVSLVVACYDEASHLEASMDETFRVLDALAWTWEVIFVDDASRDDTRSVINRIVKAHPRRNLRVILHEKNVGRGGTVADGLRQAQGRFAGFFDIDLEVHARYLLPCVLALEGGADIASAQRIYRFHWRSLDRFLLSRGYQWLLRRMVGVPLIDTETGFKIFRRERILPVLDQCTDVGWFWDTEIMVRAYFAGLRITEVPALFIRRFDKVSTVRPVRDTVDYLGKLWRFRSEVRSLRARRGPE
jgi:glycosyltransferase involved in cell wall biosynthesis